MCNLNSNFAQCSEAKGENLGCEAWMEVDTEMRRGSEREKGYLINFGHVPSFPRRSSDDFYLAHFSILHRVGEMNKDIFAQQSNQNSFLQKAKYCGGGNNSPLP